MSQFSDFYNVSKKTGELSPVVRSRRDGVRFCVPVPPSELPSRTKRSPDHVRAADINFIVARYKKTGELPVSKRAPMFAAMGPVDLKEALDVVRAAEQSFALLPAKARAAFNNDPKALLEALDNSKDPKVHQYLFEAGILEAPPVAKEPSGKGSKGAPAREVAPKGGEGSREPVKPAEE